MKTVMKFEDGSSWRQLTKVADITEAKERIAVEKELLGDVVQFKMSGHRQTAPRPGDLVPGLDQFIDPDDRLPAFLAAGPDPEDSSYLDKHKTTGVFLLEDEGGNPQALVHLRCIYPTEIEIKFSPEVERKISLLRGAIGPRLLMNTDLTNPLPDKDYTLRTKSGRQVEFSIQNGVLHGSGGSNSRMTVDSVDGAAWIVRNDLGFVEDAAFFQNGLLDRDGGRPAVVQPVPRRGEYSDKIPPANQGGYYEFHEGGVLKRIEHTDDISIGDCFWFQNRKVSREGGPAYVSNTEVSSAHAYCRNGRLHNDDGVASVVVGSEDVAFHQNGKRLDGAVKASSRERTPVTAQVTTFDPID
ncbi:hypothetical protein [Roseibium aggregatum]|jgi:hypothetical protein|uniref:Uncharacterized protein n=1 Tax=Roseibium aggregatum TaxID=187304 RepID=A0A0M6YCE2_9HYPH|nr:hypothetical protein [Roseibium aggregatum]CTQ47338.1 hypothetical protein LAL4801_05800 [Roseibium aggregatum]